MKFKARLGFWIFLGIATMVVFPETIFGQYTKQDSGWVSLFNGTNFDSLYIRLGSGTLRDPDVQTAFEVDNGEINVTGSGGIGHIASQGVFENFQVRVQYKYNTSSNGRNAGLLYHIPEDDYLPSQSYGSASPITYNYGSFVTSIEFQMYNGGNDSHAGAFLGIGNVWGKSTIDQNRNNCPFKEGGEPYDIILGGLYCARRVGPSHDGSLDDINSWVELQLDAFEDSATHWVNGEVALKAWNIEWNNGTGPRLPMTGGHVGLQAEGANINYRNFEVRMLDDEGNPIIPGCTDSLAPNHLPIANTDDGSCEPVGITNGAPFNDRIHIRKTLDGLLIDYDYGSGSGTIEIYNLEGSLVKSFSNLNVGALQWTPSPLDKGLFFIRSGNRLLKVSI